MMEKLLRYKKFLKPLIPQRPRLWLKRQVGYRMAKEIAAARGIREDHPWGVNLYGDLAGASGLAEAARSTRAGLEKAEIPVAARDFETESGQALLAPYGMNLIHMNPNLMPEILFKIPKEQWMSRRNIGFWLWEQEELPKDWLGFLPLFDEVWTSSAFCGSAIQESCRLPVTVIPHIVEPVCDASCARAAFGLPEDVFLFLVMFDCNSVAERKNPWGAIRAFQKAFEGSGERAGLVIKARNLDDRTRKELREQLRDCPHVWLLEGDYPKEQVNSLIRGVDVYVSLHRAEGFGLVLAESMYLGTPVIATNWSANTEFMNEDVACMVEAKLVRLEKDILPYRRGSRWADPDLEQAAGYMRRLYEDREYRSEIAGRAEAYVRERLSTDRVAGLLEARAREIRRELE